MWTSPYLGKSWARARGPVGLERRRVELAVAVVGIAGHCIRASIAGDRANLPERRKRLQFQP
jgi:hypothetical protein